MSGQRSDWRDRLHANPSRMEQELAFKLQEEGIFLPDTGRDTSNNSRLLLPNTTQTTNSIRRRPGPRWKDPEYQRRRTTNPTKKERIPSPRTILQQLLRQEKRPTLPQYSGLSRQLGSTRDSTTLRNGHAKNEILRARMNSSDLEWGNKVNMWILPVLLLGQ